MRKERTGDPSRSNAMLCYVDDALPGITRRRNGRYFAYFDPDGKRITDRDEIDRLNKIGLPPAYHDAWLCPSPRWILSWRRMSPSSTCSGRGGQPGM